MGKYNECSTGLVGRRQFAMLEIDHVAATASGSAQCKRAKKQAVETRSAAAAASESKHFGLTATVVVEPASWPLAGRRFLPVLRSFLGLLQPAAGFCEARQARNGASVAMQSDDDVRRQLACRTFGFKRVRRAWRAAFCASPGKSGSLK